MNSMTDTKNMAQEQAESWAKSLEEIWERIDADDRGEGSGHEEPRDELHEMPLEVVWEVGEPFAVVLGTGGPHTEITGGGRASGSGYVLTSYWGGDTGCVRSEAVQRTGEYFREYMEESSS